MQTLKMLLVLAAVASMTLASCSSSRYLTDTSTGTLANTSWFLTNLNGQSPMPGSRVTINFENGMLSGSDGCNNYHASYTLNAGKLSLDKNIAATMMACPEPVMQQASAFIQALREADALKREGSQLILADAGGKTLATFTKQSGDLSGTSWIVTASNNGKQAVVGVVNDTTLTVIFGAGGKLSGSAGCNSYTGGYQVSGKNITIESLASTRKMCVKPAGIMEQEAQFMKALATVASFQFDGKGLSLRTADDALAVMLVRP